MQFSDKKTDMAMAELLRHAQGDNSLVERAMFAAMKESQRTKRHVGVTRIKEIIDAFRSLKVAS